MDNTSGFAEEHIGVGGGPMGRPAAWVVSGRRPWAVALSRYADWGGGNAAPPEASAPPPTSMFPSAKPELLSMVVDRLADINSVYHTKRILGGRIETVAVGAPARGDAPATRSQPYVRAGRIADE